MKVKDLRANLKRENQENEIYIATQDGTDILEIFEVIDAKYGSGESFTIINPVGMDDCIEDKVADINRQIDKLDYKGKITDGSHTFDELYYHRMALFSIICNQNREFAWKSWKHDDGTMFEDYFIVGITTRSGDYSYHYHKNHWNKFKVKELGVAPKWDGHVPNDVMRLLALLD